jgi:SAM-dependent methyltransferase
VDAYEEDLAYIHDVGYDFHVQGCTPGLLQLLRTYGITSGKVVDLGCGGGIWLRALVDAGFQAVGVDISPAMIKIARRRVPEAELRAESFLNFRFPECEVVTSLGEPFNYLFDARNSIRQLERLSARVFEALRPGGLFVFDVAEPGRGTDVSQSWRQGEDWACLVQTHPDPKRARLTRQIIAFRRRGQHYRRSSETHTLQLYTSGEIAPMLRRAGFRVRIVRQHGDYPLPKNIVGFIARKP